MEIQWVYSYGTQDKYPPYCTKIRSSAGRILYSGSIPALYPGILIYPRRHAAAAQTTSCFAMTKHSILRTDRPGIFCRNAVLCTYPLLQFLWLHCLRPTLSILHRLQCTVYHSPLLFSMPAKQTNLDILVDKRSVPLYNPFTIVLNRTCERGCSYIFSRSAQRPSPAAMNR